VCVKAQALNDSKDFLLSVVMKLFMKQQIELEDLLPLLLRHLM
jgi:hypothetical protein